METTLSGIGAQIGHNPNEGAEFKVFGDVLRHSKIRIPPGETLQNHLAFIKEIILPAFLDLYKRWPAGYRLLMSGGVTIKYLDKPHPVYKETLANGFFDPDKNTIYINAFNLINKKPASRINHAIYHEIMHAVDFAAGGKKRFLTDIINKKTKRLLCRIQYDLSQRQMFCTDKDKYRIWSSYDTSIFNDIELLAEGLCHYFGTPQEKARLKKLEPKLYNIIEKMAIPAVCQGA